MATVGSYGGGRGVLTSEVPQQSVGFRVDLPRLDENPHRSPLTRGGFDEPVFSSLLFGFRTRI